MDVYSNLTKEKIELETVLATKSDALEEQDKHNTEKTDMLRSQQTQQIGEYC